MDKRFQQGNLGTGTPLHKRLLVAGVLLSIAATLLWAWGAWQLMGDWLADRPGDLARWRGILRVGAPAIIVAILAGGWLVDRLIARWIGDPARTLVKAAEAIAVGDLSLDVRPSGIDEVRRLSESIVLMLGELRELVGALHTSSSETSSLAHDITAATEQMAAASGEVAHTAADLSQQATVMAQTVQELTDGSAELNGLAALLTQGAHEGVERNARLRALATENRGRLDEGARALDTLSGEADASVAAAATLVAESQEIQEFLVLTRKLARQSKLLALNAAMEAARAGAEGEGFSVVAHEVRRLAQMSNDAADRTEQVVRRVLGGVEQVRDASTRMRGTVGAVREVTALGARSFSQIEDAVTQLEAWTADVDRTADSAYDLTRQSSAKLESLAAGTETFAAAMQQVAASSEEQSAGTEEVASAASALTAAAARLEALVGRFRLPAGGDGPPAAPAPPSPSAPEPRPILPMAAD
ncbi:MAG TPA: methyl-accepting chemotaxis protein [Gemmatimonadaceae bacterium]